MLLLILLFFSCFVKRDELVKVNLVGYPQLDTFSIKTTNQSKVFINNMEKKDTTYHFFPRLMKVVTTNNEHFIIDEIKIISGQTTEISCKYGNQEYKGDFIIKSLNNKLMIINILNLDDYLAAVLGAEMGDNFSKETLKAQMIAIRSYYYARKKQYENVEYNINNTDGLDMVYRGCNFATEKMYAILSETENLVLFDKANNIAMPLFHSTCGGLILKDNALNSSFDTNEDMVLLVDKDNNGIPLSADSPYFRFHFSITNNAILKILQSHIPINDICEINLKYFKQTNCVDFMGFIDKNGKTLWVKAYQFLSWAQKKGYNDLRSIQFQIKKNGNSYQFSGLGFGHLCGMSQYSAEKLAKRGNTYLQILKRYYPYFEVKKRTIFYFKKVFLFDKT